MPIYMLLGNIFGMGSWAFEQKVEWVGGVDGVEWVIPLRLL